MKIAVSGKGGVGKTTVSATLAHLYAQESRKVIAADVDPDANLGLALGFPEEVLDEILPISTMRKMISERTNASPDRTFYKLNPKVNDLVDLYAHGGKVNFTLQKLLKCSIHNNLHKYCWFISLYTIFISGQSGTSTDSLSAA